MARAERRRRGFGGFEFSAIETLDCGLLSLRKSEARPQARDALGKEFRSDVCCCCFPVVRKRGGAEERERERGAGAIDQGGGVEKRWPLSHRKKKLEKKKTSQAQGKLHAQWASLAAAKPKSFKGVMHRLSQAVLEREDPDAAFLRSLPSSPDGDGKGDGGGDGGGEEDEKRRQQRGGESASSSSSSSSSSPLHFTLHHPASQPERLVRRRTRLSPLSLSASNFAHVLGAPGPAAASGAGALSLCRCCPCS